MELQGPEEALVEVLLGREQTAAAQCERLPPERPSDRSSTCPGLQPRARLIEPSQSNECFHEIGHRRNLTLDETHCLDNGRGLFERGNGVLEPIEAELEEPEGAPELHVGQRHAGLVEHRERLLCMRAAAVLVAAPRLDPREAGKAISHEIRLLEGTREHHTLLCVGHSPLPVGASAANVAGLRERVRESHRAFLARKLRHHADELSALAVPFKHGQTACRLGEIAPGRVAFLE